MNRYNQFMQAVGQFRNQMNGVNPDQIIQQMMHSGKLTQSQYNMARNRFMQIQQEMMGSPGAQGRT